jgi:hypothetical protein
MLAKSLQHNSGTLFVICQMLPRFSGLHYEVGPFEVSDETDALSETEPFVDRRRDEAEAISNCCLVCSCIILINDQLPHILVGII